MAVRKEIAGKTYEIDLSVAAQARVENIADKPFSAVVHRFLNGFTGDMHLVLDNCVLIVDEKGIRPIKDDEKGTLTHDTKNATLFAQVFLEALEEYKNFIGVKVESQPPSETGVSVVTPQKASGKSRRGKLK
jgi:hypothetical protein